MAKGVKTKKRTGRKIKKSRRLLKQRLPVLKRKKVKIEARKKSLKRKRAVKVRRAAGQPRYILNNSFEFLYELRDLVLKASPAEKISLIGRINKLGRIRLAIIAGIFMNRESPDPTVADLLIVGDDIDQRRLRAFLKSLEAEVGKEIKFAVMEKEEFQYRWSMFDRFIRVLLESPHEKLINKLGL